MSHDVLLEVSGTIHTLYPIEHDGISGQYIQKIIIDNAQVTHGITQVPMRLLIVLKVADAAAPIPFQVNKPLTAKGFFRRLPTDFLSFLHKVHAPSGYLRYDGKIYK